MNKLEFSFLNRIIAIVVFTIALSTFSLTVEPTASFWDAGEYISTSAKLQVGHPPGAPLYQMMGAFFSLFANGNENIALMVNFMSVLSSSFAILFLYLSLVIIIKKFTRLVNENPENAKFSILGSSAIGSLSLCFSDSFWFNAVEAEVYAMATLILAVLFWLALKWEEEMNTEYGDRWLLIISFVIGLSFGVHFMGLLTIPAIGMIYFFKNTKKNYIQEFYIIKFNFCCHSAFYI
tara:strand:- start:337 stop:1041 length:705 start_codon:yes stop_codon:yes gene_type:complete